MSGVAFDNPQSQAAELALLNDPLFSQATVVKDASLGTSEPVFTDRFTIYYQEAEDIKTSLDSYFEQLYPEENPVVIQAEAVRTSVDDPASSDSASEVGSPLLPNLRTNPSY